MNVTSRLRTTMFVIALLLALFSSGCEQWQVVTFDNQTSLTIKLDIRPVPPDYSGTPRLTWNDPGVVIEAGKSVGVTSVQRSRKANADMKYSVVAVTETDEVVFSKVFSWDELHDIGWKIVISPKT